LLFAQTRTSSPSLERVLRDKGDGTPRVSTRPSSRWGRRKHQFAPSADPLRLVPGTDCASRALSKALTACGRRSDSRQHGADDVRMGDAKTLDRWTHPLTFRVIPFGDDYRALCCTRPDQALWGKINRRSCDEHEVGAREEVLDRFACLSEVEGLRRPPWPDDD